MRVIAGLARGQRLKSGKGDKARPTTDRAKESLFNILGNLVVDTEFLDLYAGFGGIGIEALSRGAKHVVFVEKDVKHHKIIQENVKMTKFEDQAQVICGDVLKVLPTLKKSYDLIYLDPPYESGVYGETLELIHAHQVLVHDGILILEHSRDIKPEISEHYEVRKYKQYGEVGLTFLVWKG